MLEKADGIESDSSSNSVLPDTVRRGRHIARQKVTVMIPTTPVPNNPPAPERDIITISDNEMTPKKLKSKRPRTPTKENQGAKSAELCPPREQSEGKARPSGESGNNPAMMRSKHKVFQPYLNCS